MNKMKLTIFKTNTVCQSKRKRLVCGLIQKITFLIFFCLILPVQDNKHIDTLDFFLIAISFLPGTSKKLNEKASLYSFICKLGKK